MTIVTSPHYSDRHISVAPGSSNSAAQLALNYSLINKKSNFVTIDEANQEDELREQPNDLRKSVEDLQEIAESIMSPVNNKNNVGKGKKTFKDALGVETHADKDDDSKDDLGELSIDQVT